MPPRAQKYKNLKVNGTYVDLKCKSLKHSFVVDCYFVGDNSVRMAPGGQLGEKRDGATPERQTLGCGGGSGLSLLLERTRPVPGEQGQTETHARLSVLQLAH